MVKGKRKIITNRNQGNMAVSPTTANPRYSITSEKKELYFKSYLMMLMEDFKKNINNSLKEIQNMGQ